MRKVSLCYTPEVAAAARSSRCKVWADFFVHLERRNNQLCSRLQNARILLVSHTGLESRGAKNSTENQTEAQLTAEAHRWFSQQGWSCPHTPDRNTVTITFYQGQKKLLQRQMDRACEVHTVDSFQGSESSVVLLSFVRSGVHTGFLDTTPERLNVALTRAKDLLLIFANVDGLLGRRSGAGAEKDNKRGEKKKVVSALLSDLLDRAKEPGGEVAVVSGVEMMDMLRVGAAAARAGGVTSAGSAVRFMDAPRSEGAVGSSSIVAGAFEAKSWPGGRDLGEKSSSAGISGKGVGHPHRERDGRRGDRNARDHGRYNDLGGLQPRQIDHYGHGSHPHPPGNGYYHGHGKGDHYGWNVQQHYPANTNNGKYGRSAAGNGPHRDSWNQNGKGNHGRANGGWGRRKDSRHRGPDGFSRRRSRDDDRRGGSRR